MPRLLVLLLLLAAGCEAPQRHHAGPGPAWPIARARLLDWTACKLPERVTEVAARDATWINSVVDVRFVAPAEDGGRWLTCWSAARDALAPGGMSSSAMVDLPEHVTGLRSVALAYDVARRHRTIHLEVGELPEGRRAVRIATVGEGGTPERGPPGTVLRY